MVTNLFFPLDFSVDGSMENVCKEVSGRLDLNKFRVFAFSSKSSSENNLIQVPKCKSNTKALNYLLAAGKFLVCLPKLSYVPDCILNVISIPQHVLLHMYRKKDKLALTFHGVPTIDEKCFLSGKFLSSKANVIISVSNYCAEHVKKYYKKESDVIYNGVNTQFFKPIEHFNERIQVLYVGRLINWKRPDWVVRLAKTFPECDFVLHGNGPMAQQLKHLSAKYPNLKIDTSFITKDDLRNLYAKSDIFLFPSTDWSPLVVLEAMSCGLPLVLHKIGGQAECLEEGKQGLLANSFFEMQENLRYMIEDETARREMGKNSRTLSFAFDWSKIAKQYTQLYLKLDHKI